MRFGIHFHNGTDKEWEQARRDGRVIELDPRRVVPTGLLKWMRLESTPEIRAKVLLMFFITAYAWYHVVAWVGEDLYHVAGGWMPCLIYGATAVLLAVPTFAVVGATIRRKRGGWE